MGHAPVKNTCPDIDAVIASIRRITKLCDLRRVDEENATDLKEIISDIESELWGMEDTLEQLRKDNAALREWGHEMSDKADTLQEEIDSLTENAQNT